LIDFRFCFNRFFNRDLDLQFRRNDFLQIQIMIITIQLINIFSALKLTSIKLSHFILLWSNILYFSQHKIQDIQKIQINLFCSLFKNLQIKNLRDNLFECPKLNWLEVAEQYLDRIILFQNFFYSIWWKIQRIYLFLFFALFSSVGLRLALFFLLLFDHYFKNWFFKFNYNNNWILLILYGCRIQKIPKLWNTLFFYFQV
jgi:hypothetical protein